MNLRVYHLKDPRTNAIEEVYEYPATYLPHNTTHLTKNKCVTVSREVMKFPILSIPAVYLTELPNARVNAGFTIFWSNELTDYFYSFDENVSEESRFNRFIAKVLTQLVVPIANSYSESHKTFWWPMLREIDNDDFRAFLKSAYEKKFPWNYIKNTVEMYHEWNQEVRWTNYKELTEMFPLEVISDTNELELICDKVLADNAKSVEDYRKGKTNSINHLKGQVMKATKGKANQSVVNIILERKLNGK